MTSLNLRDALKAYDNEREWNNGRIPDWVHTLAYAARGIVPKHAIVIEADTIEEALDQMWSLASNQQGWEADSEEEGGQPNGIGEIEDNYSREWFDPERESHHRQAWDFHSPWVEGPTAAVREKREKEAARQRQLAEEREAARKAAEPDEALLEVAKGLYGAQRLKDGFEKLKPWSQLSEANHKAWVEEARRFIKEGA